MPSSFKIGAAALGLASLASAAFDPASKTNVAVYWGQGASQKNLIETCKNSDVDIVNVAFINRFPDNSPAHYPGSDFGNQCWAETYTVDNTSTKLYEFCNAIGPDITECQQKYGKTIMLSLGGATPGTYYLASDESAGYFANFLWKAFGPVQSGYTGPRPFGSAVVDGFDLDIESHFDDDKLPTDDQGRTITDYKSRGYAKFVDYMREHYTEDSSKKYYISGAPQCLLPEAWLGDAITKSHFDWLFVQFYNTPQCSARAALDSSAQQQGYNLNFNQWNALSSGNDEVKVLLGLPAAPGAAAPGYYLSQEEAYSVIKMVAKYSRFGGVGLWESKFSQDNTLCGKEYSSWMKTLVNAVSSGKTVPSNFASCPVVSSTSSAVVSSSSAVVSSSSAIVSTSSAVVSSSSAVVSSSSAMASSSSSSAAASSSDVVSSSAMSTSAVSSSASASSSEASSAAITSAATGTCMSKPSHVHTKSRTRAAHSIRHCQGSTCALSTGAASTGAVSSKAVSSKAVSSKPVHSASVCKSRASRRVSSKAVVTSAPVSSSSAAAVMSSSAQDYTVTDITTVYTTYCPGTTTITTGGSTLTSTYDSTTVITTTIRTTVPCTTTAAAASTSSAAAVTSGAVASTSSAAAVTSSAAMSSSSQAAVTSSAKDYTTTEIVKVYTTYCPGTTTMTTGGSTITSTYDSTTVITTTITSTVPCSTSTAAVTSSAAKSSSSQADVKSSAPVTSMMAESSSKAAPSSSTKYTVTDITTVYTTYCPGTSTITTSGSTYTKTYDSTTVITTTIRTTVPCETSTAPVYGGASSSPVVWTSSAPVYGGASSSPAVMTSSTPVYGGSSSVAASSSAPGYGPWEEKSWSKVMETSSAPAGYKPVTSASVVAVSSAKVVPSASVGTITVVPVGPSGPAKYTATPSKPAVYTGAAVKPVALGMLPVVFGAAAFLF